MMSKPLISIIIPTYNRAHLIDETLDSVIAQTYTNWECIIVDDGSTDNTEVIVSNYIKKDQRFTFVKRPINKKGGGNAARNYGISLSKADFVIFLDSDDLLTVDCLEARQSIMEDVNSDFDMLISHSAAFKKQIGDSDLLWNTLSPERSDIELIKRFLNIDMPWSTNGVTWSKSFINKIGQWDDAMIAWQDWELHTRALFNNPKIVYSLKSIDNYFRKDDAHVNIGKKYKSIAYLQSIEKAVNTIASLILHLDKTEQRNLKPYLTKFSTKMLVAFPIVHGNSTYPLQSLFQLKKFKILNWFGFVKTYLVLFSSRSYKIKQKLFLKAYKKIQNSLILDSTHLKLAESDINKTIK